MSSSALVKIENGFIFNAFCLCLCCSSGFRPELVRFWGFLQGCSIPSSARDVRKVVVRSSRRETYKKNGTYQSMYKGFVVVMILVAYFHNVLNTSSWGEKNLRKIGKKTLSSPFYGVIISKQCLSCISLVLLITTQINLRTFREPAMKLQ